MDRSLILSKRPKASGSLKASLDGIPFWEPHGPGNRKRIEALKKAHEISVKTFAGIEPWIPEITRPEEIVQSLRDFVDRFIIGSMQYCNVPRSFYAKWLPGLISWLDENKVNYHLKRELQECTPA